MEFLILSIERYFASSKMALGPISTTAVSSCQIQSVIKRNLTRECNDLQKDSKTVCIREQARELIENVMHV
jgi:hypothetical protein